MRYQDLESEPELSASGEIIGAASSFATPSVDGRKTVANMSVRSFSVAKPSMLSAPIASGLKCLKPSGFICTLAAWAQALARKAVVKRVGSTWTYSPSDLVNFTESPYASAMDRRLRMGLLEDHETQDAEDPVLTMLAARGYAHESKLTSTFKSKHPGTVVIDGNEKAATGQTGDAMDAGAPVVAQAKLRFDGFEGYADYLVRVERPCREWAWSYEVWDSKLSRTVKPKHLLQLCCYSEMLDALQGGRPEEMVVFTGDGQAHRFRVAEFGEMLREGVFVDLYGIVRNGIAVGEPRYSIKNMERFYADVLDRDEDDVKNGGASIEVYSQWDAERDGATWRESDLLRQLYDYNSKDCDSTMHLARFLRGVQAKAGLALRDTPEPPEREDTRSDARKESDEKRAQLKAN